MTSLIPLEDRSLDDRFEEWAALVADFDGAPLHGSGFFAEHRPVSTPEGYAEYLAIRRDEADPGVPAKDGWVKCSYFLIAADDAELVGFLALRHELNDGLRRDGGHIGYAVRPSGRRQGHATAALAAGLGEAASRGIEQALLTCDDDNGPSARTIVANGGELFEVSDNKRYFWVPTAR